MNLHDDPEIHKITLLHHVLICREEHAKNIELIGTENKCDWYLEETLASCWIERSHAKWLGEVINIYETTGLEDPQKLRLFYDKVLTLVKQIHFMPMNMKKLALTLLTKSVL